MIRTLLPFMIVLFFNPLKAQFSGNSLDFDGTNDQVDIATVPYVLTSPATSDFTIEGWVYPRGSVFARIFFAQSSSSNFVSLGTNTGNTIYFYVIKNGVTVSVATTASIPQNQWTHVAARWTSATSTAEVFFNGTLQSAGNGGSSSTGTSGIVTIGARTGGGQHFNGQLDEIRVWNSAISSCQIQSNMNNTIPSAQSGLLMNYNFNQGVAGATNASVTTLPDLSGNAYQGSLANFALNGSTSNWVSSSASLTASGFSNTSVSAATSHTNTSCNGLADGMASVTASGVGPFTYTWMPGGANTASVTSLGAGTYTVTVGNACGTVSNFLTINQPAPVTLLLSSSPGSVCAGSTATLSATGSGGTAPITYTWSGGTASPMVVVSPTATTVYTLNASDVNGCVASSTLNLPVNSLPTVSLSATPNNLCVNSGSVALNGSPSGGSFSGTNVSGTAFTPLTTGTYTPVYAYTDALTGCSNTATITIVVSACTGIAEPSARAGAIYIYPNPNRGEFRINLAETAVVSISDMVGRTICQEHLMESGEHQLDLRSFDSGIYLVRVQQRSGLVQLKVFKQ